jgi:hypothetical protein
MDGWVPSAGRTFGLFSAYGMRVIVRMLAVLPHDHGDLG